MVTGERPAVLLEPRPRGRVLRHTVEQMADVCLFVQILGAPVPQTGDQLVSFFKFLDTVIAVPKITKDLIQPCLVDCDQRYPQMAEQLVEVPTIVSYSSLQRVPEQIVDIPVPRCRGVRAVEVFKAFPQHRVQRRLVELKVEVFRVSPETVFSAVSRADR